MMVVFTIISASSVSSRYLRGALNLALINLFRSLEKSMAARECFSTHSKRSQVLAWNVFSLLHPKRLSNVSVIQRFSLFSNNETEQILKETLKLCSCKLPNCILEFKLNADFLEVNYRAENNWRVCRKVKEKLTAVSPAAPAQNLGDLFIISIIIAKIQARNVDVWKNSVKPSRKLAWF